MLRIRIYATIAIAAVLAGSAAAFEWDPESFPEGDQRYVMEFTSGAGDDAFNATVEMDLTDMGDSFDVVTTVSVRQDVPKDEMEVMGMGGMSASLSLIGPAVMFGPAFMLLPMMLEGQDIRVRQEPLIMVGMGELHMERTEEVAGHECVVIRFVPNSGDESFEFALAEDLPFPCFSRFGSGDEITEMRLISAE